MLSVIIIKYIKKGMNEMKNIKTGTYTYNEESYNFNFGTDLSISDKARFVNFATGVIVDEDDYNAVIRNLVFDFCVIEFFTDIDTTEIKQSSTFVNTVEQFLEETSIVDVVKVNMVDGLLEELNNAVDKAIAYKTGISINPLTESLTSLINTLEKKVKEFDMGEMMEMAKTFSGMTGELTPDSIVNAYLNSDIHKKNLDEIEEVKRNKSNKDNITDIDSKK